MLNLLLLCVLAISVAPGGGSPKTPLTVGWHDELNSIREWQPIGLENAADVFAARPGAMTLRLPRVPDGFPYTYQWSGVTRTVVVDLDRYPVIVARLTSIGKGSYAHLDIEERDFSGKAVRILRSNTLKEPGLSIADVGRSWGGYTRRIVLRLIVGGELSGASCEYAWVRFIRREDLPRLKEIPDMQSIRLVP